MALPAPPSVASTKETTNYARLCRLLVDLGSQALRDIFDGIHPPSGLHGVLAGHPEHVTLKSLRKKKILNSTQWGKLYPTVASSVPSASFDITLLMVLLRHICGLHPPATGWDSLPPPTDTSTEANIVRVKYYRNIVYAHASQASVDDATFNTNWQDISNALVALGGASYGAAINKLKNECMDPDMEENYREQLQQWKKYELGEIDASRLYDQLIKEEISLRSYLDSKTYTPELKRVLSVICGRLAASGKQEIAEALISSVTAKANAEMRKRPSLSTPMQRMLTGGSRNDGGDMWVTVVLECIKESQGNSDLYKHLASKFGELLKLKTVTLKNTQISNDEVVVLVHALKANKTLTELDLSCNSIGDNGAASIADVLKCNTILKVLNLSQNNIGVEGAECLADGLRQGKPTLENLKMSSNNIGVAGAKKLANVLESTCLTLLDLSYNNIGNDGAASLSNALKCNSTLKGLNLSHNDIGNDGALCLADALKQCNQNLELVLNLSSNGIGDAGAVSLAYTLQCNRTLHLNLSDNRIDKAGNLFNGIMPAGRVQLY